MINYGNKTGFTQEQDPVKRYPDEQFESFGRSDPIEQQLQDDFANGVSDPSLPDGTNNTQYRDQIETSLTSAKSVFSSTSLSMFPDSYLILNDIVLTGVPTAAISIEAAADVFVGETVRSQAPVIDSEGRQDLILRLSLSFPPGEAQANKLKRLVAEASKHPFIFVYNNDIKQKLDLGESDTTIFVLEAATLRSTTGTVGLIVLDMQLHYFNYKPFSNHFYYNARLPGFTEEPEHKSFSEISQVNLSEFGGYEASDYTISKIAERTSQQVRDGIKNLTKSKKENLPVNFPSASDAWMYFANHLERQSKPIAGEPSDYIGFRLREFFSFQPPEDRQAENKGTLVGLMNSRYTEIHPLYQAKAWKEALADKANEATRRTPSGTTASERRADELVEFSQNTDPTRPINFTNVSGGKLTIPLLDENGNVPTETRWQLTKFADRRKLTANEPVFLSVDLIKLVAAVANNYPGRTIEIISTQRDPNWVKKGLSRPKKKPSNHILGTAMDFRVRGIPNRDLFEFIKRLPRVGAGYYPNSVFCHMDARPTSTFWVDASGKGEKSNYLIKTGSRSSLNKYLNDHYALSGDHISGEIASDVDEIESDFGTKEDRKKQTKDVAKQQGTVAELIQKKQDLAEGKTNPEKKVQEQKKLDKGTKSLQARIEWIESIEKQHKVHYYYDDPKVKNVFYRDIEINVSSDPDVQRSGQALKNIVCSAVSVNFGHRIAPMPLLSQPFYSYQFLGAGNKSGQIVLTFAGAEGRRSAAIIKQLIWKARDNARTFTSIIKSVGSIGLEHTHFGTGEQNTIMALAGIDNIVISDIQESNSPDGADKHQLVIEFINQEFAEEKYEQKMATTLGDKQKIIKSILQYVKTVRKKDVNRTGNQTINIIHADNSIVRMNASDTGRPHRLIGNTPLWVGKMIAEAAKICRETDDKMPPISWKIHKKTGQTWRDIYKVWGAGNIFTGDYTRIASNERNAAHLYDYYGPMDNAAKDIADLAKGRNDEYNGKFEHNGSPETNRLHKNLFDAWLSRMEILVREFYKHMADSQVMDEFFPGVTDGIKNVISGDISSCYKDIDLPSVPGTIVPLPPEFYVYDDSHEDPLVSSMTDDKNMEKFLRRHAETEYASIERYIDKCFLGGSYLSKNLPRILEQRASEHERSEGERNVSSYWDFYTNGAKSWEPLYTRKDKQDPAIAGVQKWQSAVSANLGDGTPTDQRKTYLNNLLKMPAYVRNGRNWDSPITERDNSNLIKAMYKGAEEALVFGPNPLYASVDDAMSGKLTEPSTQKLADDIEAAKQKAADTTFPTEVLPGEITVTPDGAVTFGETKAEKEAAVKEEIDEAKSSDAGRIAGGVATGGVFGAFTKFFEKQFEKQFERATSAGIDMAAAKYDHVFSKIKKDKEFDQMAQAASRVSLGKKQNDLSMRRAYPTFKIFFIEDDSTETELVEGGVVRAFDDFYSYSAIQEIKITRSRKIAADMAIIRMTNVGGLLLRRRFGESDKSHTKYGKNAEKQGIFADTEREHPFEKMILQDGVKVQIRLGYAANQDNLESVFLGQVVEMSLAEKGKIIEIACQGYGAELESVEFGPLENGPYFMSSQEVLSGSTIHPSIVNFGRQDRFAMDNPAAARHAWTGGRGTNLISDLSPTNILQEWSTRGLESVFNQYQFKNFQQDDNIYAPPPDSYASTWTKFWNNACIYRPLKQTSWEIFKEHELRHPGYISSAVPYGHEPRMTMFFGNKVQHYWSKPPSALEVQLSRSAKNDIIKIRKEGLNLLHNGMVNELVKFVEKSPEFGSALFNDIMTIGSRFDVGFSLGELFGRYVPFRNYHYFDSFHHILYNEIRTSVDGTYNEIELNYSESENTITDPDADDTAENIAEVARGEAGFLALRLDENIPDSSIRSYRAEYPSCVTSDMAKRYAQGLFARTLRDSYKGELCIVGDEKLKPYDVCYLNDSSINMTGPIEVESVTHIFNRDNGFVSIITPDLCLEVNDYYTATVFDITSSAMSFTWGDVLTPNPAWTALKGISHLGLAAGVKFMTWTQEGAPVVATPLTLGGKPFISNTLGSNKTSLFFSLFGKWNQYWDDLGSAWRKFDLSEAMFNARVDMAAGFYEFFGADATGGLKEANPNE